MVIVYKLPKKPVPVVSPSSVNDINMPNVRYQEIAKYYYSQIVEISFICHMFDTKTEEKMLLLRYYKN